MLFLNNSFFFNFLNFIFFKIFFSSHKIQNYINNKNYFNYKLYQTNWEFYKTNKNNSKNLSSFFFSNSFSFISGFKYFWSLIRFWVLGIVLFIFSFCYLTYIRLLPLNKLIFEWFLIVMFLYWLLSGFVFFFKKYQFSKFTSVIQRFWKRTYILFWLIESGVFVVYFYLTMNASEEPVYMYDQLKLYKTHFFSWRLFIIKLVPVVTLIIMGYYVQLSLKWSVFGKQNVFLLAITLLLIYVFWLEFYQFFHIINFYGNLNWIFDYDEFLWNLELEFRRTRLSNNYIAICLMAKFWHLVFIFVFWVFFILRINELKRVRYPLLAANVQNFIILYIMSWLYMYPWFKFVFRNFLDNSFYWFMTNNRTLAIRLFFNDLKIFINILIFDFINIFGESLLFFKTTTFFYWIEASNATGFNNFKKHALKDYIISSFTSI